MFDLDPKMEDKMARLLSALQKDPSINPNLYEELKKNHPSWLTNDASSRVSENKRKLIEIAYGNDPRPNLRKHPLGAALRNYTSKKCNSYDEEFDKTIRKIRPDWFIENVVNQKKKEIEKMAKKGLSKPNWKTNLGRVFTHYTSAKSASYDPVFTAKMKKLRPDWFGNDHVENEKKIAKQKIIGLALVLRSSRPNKSSELGKALIKFTQKGRTSYDANFDQLLRELRPDWFTRLFTRRFRNVS